MASSGYAHELRPPDGQRALIIRVPLLKGEAAPEPGALVDISLREVLANCDLDEPVEYDNCRVERVLYGWGST